jgi:ankyrin repeat protein
MVQCLWPSERAWIYHSPVAFIRTLLELGADPDPKDHAGFPPLIAALSCHQASPGSKARIDVAEIVALLLSFGADPDQRGINDFTALHMAAAVDHPEAVRLLLGAGANPNLRTRIDDYETPREFAGKAQRRDIAALLASAERSFIQR